MYLLAVQPSYVMPALTGTHRHVSPLQHPMSILTGMMPEEGEEEENPQPAKKIRKLEQDKDEVSVLKICMCVCDTCQITPHHFLIGTG